MSCGFKDVIAAADADRADIFIETARLMGTTPINIEKDFWVCWTLDLLFNRRDPNGPRLLFKGGTSLSKGFGLIQRFSEDIDVTLFRSDLGHGVSVEDLEALSGKKRRERLDAIRDDAAAYVRGPLASEMNGFIGAMMAESGIPESRWSLDADEDDDQTLMFRYPTVLASDTRSVAAAGDYIRRAVKIESGAKSALDPHVVATITPYCVDAIPELDLAVTGVTTTDPCRTFWDKVVIAHGLRQWAERRGEIKGGGERLTRHYYDLFRLMADPIGVEALEDEALGDEVVRHARMFFNRTPLGLELAARGSFTLAPTTEMREPLSVDYAKMSGMLFGEVPPFAEVMDAVSSIEERLNREPALAPSV